MTDQWRNRLDDMPGDKSVYFRNLKTGGEWCYHADIFLNAASVMKLPVMLAAYVMAGEGKLDLKEPILIREQDKMPSCGVLNRLHLTRMTVRDLIELMIIVSDNTAANLLIDKIGIDSINQVMRRQGMMNSTIRRRLFDSAAASRGIQNTVSMRETGFLLTKIAMKQSIAGVQADEAMLDTLCSQRLNGKIPFYLKGKVLIAHKTGEDDGISHDVSILLDQEDRTPLCVLCFGSEHVSVPEFERFMQDFSMEIVRQFE